MCVDGWVGLGVGEGVFHFIQVCIFTIKKFSYFSQCNNNTIDYIWKSTDGVLGIPTMERRMEGGLVN